MQILFVIFDKFLKLRKDFFLYFGLFVIHILGGGGGIPKKTSTGSSLLMC